jgi:hypothetical protein
VCRALKVLCAAPSRERLSALKRAAVSVHWELVGGALSVEELETQMADWRPDVAVVDAELLPNALSRVRALVPEARVITVGAAGGDGEAASLDEIRDAILGLPKPGGPVKG